MAAAGGKAGAAWGTCALALLCLGSQGAARARGKEGSFGMFPNHAL